MKKADKEDKVKVTKTENNLKDSSSDRGSCFLLLYQQMGVEKYGMKQNNFLCL